MPSSVQSREQSGITEQMLEALEQQLIRLLVSNAHAKRKFASQLQENLPPATIPILAVALKQDQISQSEIGERLMLDKASLSRLVTRMQEAGLVERKLDPQDRRVSRINPTRQARERWDEAMYQHRSLWKSRMQDWPNEDLNRLIALLSRLNEDFLQS